MIEAVKHNEQARKEYRIMSAFEMDAREEGIQQGIRQGIEQGFFDGSYKTKLETARLMKQANCEPDFIMQMTGLSQEEVEAIN